MLKCKYDEDCSRYPMCGKTCGLSLEELLWRKNQQIRDLKHDMLIAENAKDIENIKETLNLAQKEIDDLTERLNSLKVKYINLWLSILSVVSGISLVLALVLLFM